MAFHRGESEETPTPDLLIRSLGRAVRVAPQLVSVQVVRWSVVGAGSRRSSAVAPRVAVRWPGAGMFSAGGRGSPRRAGVRAASKTNPHRTCGWKGWAGAA